MSKSHVGMGHSVCPVCGIKHDEVVLLDRRLKNTLENDNFTGWALCPEHEAMREEYIALVECSNPGKGGTKLKPEDAQRTGVICHIRRTVADHLFNVKLPHDMPLAFVEVGVIDKLRQEAS